MKPWTTFKKTALAVVIGLTISALAIIPQLSLPRALFAQSNQGYFAVLTPNFSPAALTFTATSQTGKIALSGFQSCTMQYVGTGITTATFEVKGSNDGGTTYYPLPFSTGAYTSNVLSVVTGATITESGNTAVIWWLNVASLTNLEVVTSGTFTGTSIAIKFTCSSNRGLF